MNLQEALAFARHMSSAEDVSFSTTATITCEVDISMTNTPDKGVSVRLYFQVFEGISLSASVDADYVAVPSTEDLEAHNKRVIETGEGAIGLPVSSMPVTLSAEEVCKIFNIPDTAEWGMTNHGTML